MVVRCGYCEGNGKDSRGMSSDRPCRVCRGVGSIDIPSDWVPCGSCEATGAASSGDSMTAFCNICGGKGHVKPRKYKS